MSSLPVNIAVFASGSGSNAENLIQHSGKIFTVKLVLTNNPTAGVIERCERLGVECIVVKNAEMADSSYLIPLLKSHDIHYIVLAGYLRLIPQFLIEEFPDKIINIHPALLPSYGGKGMYGNFVHAAVCRSEDAESGITIHLVNAEYDKGKILAQFRTPVPADRNPSILAQRIHDLEYAHFPQVIADYIQTLETAF